MNKNIIRTKAEPIHVAVGESYYLTLDMTDGKQKIPFVEGDRAVMTVGASPAVTDELFKVEAELVGDELFIEINSESSDERQTRNIADEYACDGRILH